MGNKFWAIQSTKNKGFIVLKERITTLTEDVGEALLLARKRDAESVLTLIGGIGAADLSVVEVDEPLVLEMQVAVPKKRKSETETAVQALAKRVWENYFAGYASRYRAEPVRNAKQNALCLGIANRLGSHAPAVAEHYLASAEALYVRNGHPLTLLLRDAEKLHTEWQTGRATPQANNPFVNMLRERQGIAS